MRAHWRWALAILVHVGVALGLTWPMPTDPAGLVVGGDRTDVWNSLWSLWFVDQVGAFAPVTTTLLDHPAGGRIAVADPLNALLAYPLVGIWGPEFAYGVLVIVHVSFAGLMAHLLGRACGGRGWLAGVGWQLAPACVAHLHNGSSEAISTGWLPLACLAVIKTVERGGLPRSLGMGLGLSLCALGGWYAGVDAWLFVAAILALGWSDVDWKTRTRRMLPGLALALAVTLPIAGAIRAVAQAPDGLVDIKNDSDLDRIRRTLGAADPRIFVTPGDFRSPDFTNLEGNPSEYVHTAYLGWALILLALWVTVRRTAPGRTRTLWLAAAGALLLSLGPVLVWGGRPLGVGAAELALPLPYLLLERVPGFNALSLLYRLAGLAALALLVLADRLHPAWVAVVAGEFLFLGPTRGLPAITPVPVHEAVTIIAAQSSPGEAVLNLPPTGARGYLYQQTIHGQPLVGSLNAGMNRSGMEVVRASRQIYGGDLPPEALGEVARGQRVRWVIQHKYLLMDEYWIQVMTGFRKHATLAAEDDRMRVYRLYDDVPEGHVPELGPPALPVGGADVRP